MDSPAELNTGEAMMNAMENIKTKLKPILDSIIDKDDVVYMDYPVYHNVGDLLIYAGALKLFEDNDVKVRLKRSVIDFSVEELRKKIGANTTIVCQGGGNFGDLYAAHQKLREDLVNFFPDNRIVILPQTLFFSSNESLSKTISVFRQHENVIIFSRDKRSYEIFKEMTKSVFMAPDTAHYLYGTFDLGKTVNEFSVLNFIRTDKEQLISQTPTAPLLEGETMDWQDLIRHKDKAIRSFIRLTLKIGLATRSSRIKEIGSSLWRIHAFSLVKKSALFFSTYEKIVSSRMHGHILACLVDKENYVIDNVYGKNSGYYDAWTKEVENAYLLETR